MLYNKKISYDYGADKDIKIPKILANSILAQCGMMILEPLNISSFCNFFSLSFPHRSLFQKSRLKVFSQLCNCYGNVRCELTDLPASIKSIKFRRGSISISTTFNLAPDAMLICWIFSRAQFRQ